MGRISEKFSVKAISKAFEVKNENSKKNFAIADVGNPMSIINEETARRLQENNKSTLFKEIPPEDVARNLTCYNGETIVPKERLIITVKSGRWKIQSVPFIIVDDQKADIIGRNIKTQVGIILIQENENDTKC